MIQKYGKGLLSIGMSCLLLACASSAEKELEAQWRSTYQQQVQILEKLGEAKAYKAGLSSQSSRERFGSDRAIAGNLYRLQDSLVPIAVASFLKPMLEVELAFRLDRVVSEPVSDVEELQRLVAEVAPALEIPDLGLIKVRPPSPQDLVASNIAAHSFALGRSMQMDWACLDQLQTRLWHNGELLAQSSSDELEGGVWQALLTLVNNRVQHGWAVTPDHWLLTGALGGMHSLTPEEYVADFSCAGQLVGRAQLLVSSGR